MSELEKTGLNSHKLQTIAHDILQEAKRLGADQSQVALTANKGFSVRVHDGEVETVEYHQDKSISIHVYFGKRSGAASLSDIRPEAIRAGVEAACHIAKFTDEDPDSGLAAKEELAFNYPQLDLNYPWAISVEEAIELGRQCEQEAMAYDKRILNAEEAGVTTMESVYVYANSNGFIGHYPHTRHEIGCVLIAKENGDMQRDYSYTNATEPSALTPIKTIAHEAANKAVKRLGARKLPTTKAPVLYIAEEARGLLGHFTSAISGGSLYRKASFLLDHLGKKVFSPFIHIQEHPHLLKALGSSPFDDDGVMTRSNVFIEDGILRNYALSVYSARKLKMHTTGNAGGVHNLTIQPGKKDLQALIKTMGRGLLVTELIGQGVNLVTGDYSRGVGGFWVENGEIQFPVHEMTIAGKLQDMYAHIVDVGNDVDVRGNIRTGSILIEEMMIAGS